MSFFEQQFPPQYSFGARGGPVFSTEANRTSGGQRYVNRNWLYPLHRYDVSAGIKKEADFEIYRAFFYNVAGQFDGFRFKDWHDFKLSMQPLAPITAGTTFQLQRAYIAGARTFYRPIFKPVPGRITIYRNRAGAVGTIGATVDYTTGIVTVAGDVAGDSYLSSGEFDVPVAFTSDVMEAVILDKSPNGQFIISWPDVQVEELRNL